MKRSSPLMPPQGRRPRASAWPSYAPPSSPLLLSPAGPAHPKPPVGRLSSRHAQRRREPLLRRLDQVLQLGLATLVDHVDGVGVAVHDPLEELLAVLIG